MFTYYQDAQDEQDDQDERDTRLSQDQDARSGVARRALAYFSAVSTEETIDWVYTPRSPYYADLVTDVILQAETLNTNEDDLQA
ncbi:MAG: hypothetical protein HYY17_04195, partial [Planctomycetes bacterium]|nr:hypothetical protein [Planctomycetota bacterium]